MTSAGDIPLLCTCGSQVACRLHPVGGFPVLFPAGNIPVSEPINPRAGMRWAHFDMAGGPDYTSIAVMRPERRRDDYEVRWTERMSDSDRALPGMEQAILNSVIQAMNADMERAFLEGEPDADEGGLLQSRAVAVTRDSDTAPEPDGGVVTGESVGDALERSGLNPAELVALSFDADDFGVYVPTGDARVRPEHRDDWGGGTVTGRMVASGPNPLPQTIPRLRDTGAEARRLRDAERARRFASLYSGTPEAFARMGTTAAETTDALNRMRERFREAYPGIVAMNNEMQANLRAAMEANNPAVIAQPNPGVVEGRITSFFGMDVIASDAVPAGMIYAVGAGPNSGRSNIMQSVGRSLRGDQRVVFLDMEGSMDGGLRWMERSGRGLFEALSDEMRTIRDYVVPNIGPNRPRVGRATHTREAERERRETKGWATRCRQTILLAHAKLAKLQKAYDKPPGFNIHAPEWLRDIPGAIPSLPGKILSEYRGSRDFPADTIALLDRSDKRLYVLISVDEDFKTQVVDQTQAGTKRYRRQRQVGL